MKIPMTSLILTALLAAAATNAAASDDKDSAEIAGSRVRICGKFSKSQIRRGDKYTTSLLMKSRLGGVEVTITLVPHRSAAIGGIPDGDEFLGKLEELDKALAALDGVKPVYGCAYASQLPRQDPDDEQIAYFHYDRLSLER